MRVTVVGASGNVGTALVRALLGAGHEVVGVCRRPPTGTEYAAAEWHPVDLTRRPGRGLRAAFDGADAVVHLAWGFQPTHDRSYLEALDVGGTAHVLDAVARTGVKHLVHQSSLGAYSPAPGRVVSEAWPTGGVPTSAYSRHKVAAERMLDAFEHTYPDVLVSRTRPSLIVQRRAASGVMRYTLPTIVPAPMIAKVPLLPLDRSLRLNLVHTDDVAEAIRAIVERRVPGPFNLAAWPAVTPTHIADALGARHVHVPSKLLRAGVAASWRARLQPVDEGWIDMAYSVPLLDTSRAERELDWAPRKDSLSVLAEFVSAMVDSAGDDTPALRRRSIADGLRRARKEGGVSIRHRP